MAICISFRYRHNNIQATVRPNRCPLKNNLNNSELKREIGFYTATILVIANMVGTGIFTTSGFVIKELGSPTAMLLCWMAGGVFALCGALCYGELGSRYPQAGGEYVYLKETFGKGMGFLSGWISLVVGFSAPIAAAAIAFAIYLFQMLSIAAKPPLTIPIMGIPVVSISLQSLVAIGIVILFSVVHYHSLKVGSRVQNLLTLFKITIVVAFISAGFLSDNGTAANFMLESKSSDGFAEKFAVSLIFVSFAYAGWNASAYIGGEIQNPGRNIPLSLLVGTVIVTGLYLLLNVIYIYALTPAQMSGSVDVGARAAISLFGKNVSKFVSGAIALGLLSVLSAMIMTGPRVYYAMSKDKIFFEFFAKISKTRHTPAHSIFLQAGIAIVLIITASYEKLLIYIGFTLSLFAMLTVAGLVRLRLKNGANPDGYRTFGYPVTPFIFIIGNLWIIWFSVKSRPVPALCGMATIGIGLCAYLYFKRRQSQSLPLNTPGAIRLAQTSSGSDRN